MALGVERETMSYKPQPVVSHPSTQTFPTLHEGIGAILQGGAGEAGHLLQFTASSWLDAIATSVAYLKLGSFLGRLKGSQKESNLLEGPQFWDAHADQGI